MINLSFIESSIRNAIECSIKGDPEGLATSFLSVALDELMKAKPVKESGDVTCSTGDKTCPFLGCRKYGTDSFCTASIDHISVFYGDDKYLVPCESCVWSKNDCEIKCS